MTVKLGKQNYTLQEIRAGLVPDKDEELFKTLGRLGPALKVPVPEAFLSIQLFDLKTRKPILIPDRNGVMREVIHQRSRSWTRNAYNDIFCQLGSVNGNNSTFGGGYLNIKDTGGTVRYGAGMQGLSPFTSPSSGSVINYETNTSYGYLSAAGAVNGIVIGTGTGAESFEDYVLGTIIPNGTGAGQMSYIAGEAPIVTYDSGTKTLTVAWGRYFNNNSSGAIDVAESGIYSRQCYGSQSPATITLVTRDLISPAVSVPVAGQLKITYTISLTYPA